jgi:hypothetical protein
MPRYQLLSRHVIADQLREPGEVVEIDYEPSLEMQPLDKAATAALAAFKDKLAGLQPVHAPHGLTHYQIRNSTMLEDLLRGLRQ